MDHLTVGGLVLGGGLESTSHKYGMFHQVCSLSKQSLWHFKNLNSGANYGFYQLVTEYELVTADAECIRASATENPDLFRVIPMSYGTFGFLTRINIRVVSYILRIMTSARVSKKICNRVARKKECWRSVKKKST